jgi:serine phosphatase RsbU (regulator of sigma subunit)
MCYTALLFIIGISSFYHIIVLNAISNDECVWVKEEQPDGALKLKFTLVKERGVTWNGGIRNGDYLLAINNIPVKSDLQAQSILNRYQTGEYADYTYERGGRVYNTKVYIKKLFDFGQLALAVFGFIWLIIGFIVVMAKPNGYVQRVFYRIGALWVLAIMIIWFFNRHGLRVQPDNSTYLMLSIADFISSIAFAYLPFLYAYFFWIFPKPVKFVEKKSFKKIYFAIPPVFIVLSIAVKIFLIANVGGKFQPDDLILFYARFYSIFLLLTYTSMVIGWVSLIINYRKLKTKDEKKPFVWILAAYTLGLTGLFYNLTIAQVIAHSVFNNPEYFMPILFVALLPISFGVSIFKYQVMDVSVVIKNAIFYGAATAGIALVYFLLVYILGQGVSSYIGTEYRSVIAGIVFVIFGWAFQSSKDKFQNILTKQFYPEQFAYQNILLRFSNEISVTVGLENILDRMQDSFVSPLKLKKFGILLLNGDEFALRRSHGFNCGEMILHDRHITKFIFKKIGLSVKPIIDKAEFKEAFGTEAEILDGEEIYTVIPLIVKNKVIGLLLFGLKFSGSEFAGKDLELLCAAANQAAISIENARLYKSEAVKLTLERDLEHARMIQNSLLPKKIPACVGLDISGIMIPAMQVGGDYYDLIRVGENKLYVIVGDVSGKGLSASLYMSKLQTIMRYLCATGKTPKEVLIEANKLIYESLEKNWFITLNIGLYDLSTRRVKFARAGHLPLLTIQKGDVAYIKPQGIGLGLEKGVVFSESLEETEIAYGENQIFAFYSDGITEAMNSKNQLFGEERLSEVIKKSSGADSCMIMTNVLDAVAEYRSAAEQNDDITLVVIKTKDRRD